MFRLEGGLFLNLYPRSELARDAQIPPGPAQSGEFSLGHIVASRTDVDAVLAPGRGSGRNHHRRAARPSLRHLLRLLPRP
jgi:hypothetical protein